MYNGYNGVKRVKKTKLDNSYQRKFLVMLYTILNRQILKTRAWLLIRWITLSTG